MFNLVISFCNGVVIDNKSASWNASLPIPGVATCPVNTTKGRESQ